MTSKMPGEMRAPGEGNAQRLRHLAELQPTGLGEGAAGRIDGFDAPVVEARVQDVGEGADIARGRRPLSVLGGGLRRSRSGRTA